jgi:hypothetical protein
MIKKVRIEHTIEECITSTVLIASFKFNKKTYCLSRKEAMLQIKVGQYEITYIERPDKKVKPIVFSSIKNKKTTIHAININNARKYYNDLLLNGFNPHE